VWASALVLVTLGVPLLIQINKLLDKLTLSLSLSLSPLSLSLSLSPLSLSLSLLIDLNPSPLTLRFHLSFIFRFLPFQIGKREEWAEGTGAGQCP
jgi:hypothetical protein